ncbi:unnamed protein product [Microthlaspi erraticum]|uniref:At4g15545-like C-terminal domain-containing protein n=1 Tax=Microthlaspi erraticum TaxID=1685480 RepID=A0A6D2L603_9BRAS|nr:unnamed protein product [Microthlaspi erraticum]
MSRIAGGDRGGRSDLELPDEILSVIPTDPLEQLDLAKKITSMAIASSVSNLEADVVELRQKLHEREIGVHELEKKASRFERDFREADSRLKIVLHDNMNLREERDSLATTVTNLRRDVAKLETFKRQLIQSLSNENALQREVVEDIKTCDKSVHWSYPDKEETTNLHSYNKSRDMTRPVDDDSNYTGPRFSVTPYISPWMTPKIISPRSNSSPKRTSGAMSPTDTHFESQKATLSYPSSQQSSAANSPPRSLPRTPRVDGKWFFRQARSRLSYEQFKAFLANVKELNAQKQTREETLRKANEIFGTENKDLYLSFQGLVSKNKT